MITICPYTFSQFAETENTIILMSIRNIFEIKKVQQSLMCPPVYLLLQFRISCPNFAHSVSSFLARILSQHLTF